MRTLRPLVAALTIASTSLVFAGQAHAACASTTSHGISGTILGSDRRYVDALIGFDVLDANKRVIGMDGCAHSGYSKTTWINSSLPPEGRVSPAAASYWGLGSLPSNAVSVTIEVYPKNPKDPYDNLGDGLTNQSRYGSAMRRWIKVGSTGVTLRLPLVCSAGGATGGIHGYVYKAGVKVQADRTRAWSREADSNTRILGWNMGTNSVGWYSIPNLAGSQNYDVWYTYKGVTIKRETVYVKPCAWTPVSVSF